MSFIFAFSLPLNVDAFLHPLIHTLQLIIMIAHPTPRTLTPTFTHIHPPSVPVCNGGLLSPSPQLQQGPGAAPDYAPLQEAYAAFPQVGGQGAVPRSIEALDPEG